MSAATEVDVAAANQPVADQPLTKGGKSLSKEVALRIALAARALGDSNPDRLMQLLAKVVAFPPTPERLALLTVKSVRAQLSDKGPEDLEGINNSQLKEALAILRDGSKNPFIHPEPTVQPYQPGDLENSIRIACSSDDGELLNGHFGSCRRFLIYQLNDQQSRLIDIRYPDADSDEEASNSKDSSRRRAQLISDCQLLFTQSIGGPAAARVVRAGIHPIKRPGGGDCSEILQSLQQVIGRTPPPWLAKAMAQSGVSTPATETVGSDSD